MHLEREWKGGRPWKVGKESEDKNKFGGSAFCFQFIFIFVSLICNVLHL